MRVLVAIDFADTTERLLDAARDSARATAADIFLLHVAEPDPAFVGYEAGSQGVRDQVAHEYREQHRQLQQMAETLRGGGLAATALLVQGPTAQTILAEAERLAADVIVMGTHGRSAVMDMVVGSVSQSVLRHTRFPVLLVPVRRR